MNQIEFIKKWAKEGDRVENNKIRYNVYKVKNDNGLYFQRFRDFGNGSYYVDSIEWQSPQIYRLGESHAYNKGYKEKWQLVADYADVAKEEESLVEEHLQRGSTGSYGNMLRDFESRIKALEEKIK